MSGSVMFTDRGYLSRSIVSEISSTVNITYYPNDIRTITPIGDQIDTIMHFASPSDVYDFNDKEKVVTTIVDGTINMINIAKEHHAKLIFASTMGVYEGELSDIYTTSKLAMENYIKSVYNNYIILRIPRVYSKCRKKGLMRQIRDNTIPAGDMDNIISYITLQDFVDQTLPILRHTNITHEYEIKHKKSIREIKQWIGE